MRLSTCYVYVKSRDVVPGLSVSRRVSKRCAHVQRVRGAFTLCRSRCCRNSGVRYCSRARYRPYWPRLDGDKFLRLGIVIGVERDKDKNTAHTQVTRIFGDQCTQIAMWSSYGKGN